MNDKKLRKFMVRTTQKKIVDLYFYAESNGEAEQLYLNGEKALETNERWDCIFVQSTCEVNEDNQYI